jgi:pimeloyl-ACP methyl ester carboxylesterase
MKKIVLLSALIIVGILYSTQIKRGCLSLLILIDAVRPPEKALMGKVIDGPTKTAVTVPSRGRKIHADLYYPHEGGKKYPLLLVHGVNLSGKDDEQIVLLAKDLSRAGFLVLVPDLEGVKNLRIRIADAEDILQSFRYLSRVENNGSKKTGSRGGMIGINVGAGPMLLAAADPRIRDKVSVVATVGGYYDLRNVLSFALTGAYEYGGHRGYVRPDASLRWMLAYKNLDLLHSSDDREKLRTIIEKRNRYEVAAAESLAKSLGPEGRAVNAFLVNTDPEHFSPLYERLPLPVREYVYQLSPARAIKYITASFVIIHGIDDYFIPYTESMRLADAVVNKGQVHLALLPQLMHSGPFEPSAGAVYHLYQRYVLGGWRLYTAIYDLLEKGRMN